MLVHNLPFESILNPSDSPSCSNNEEEDVLSRIVPDVAGVITLSAFKNDSFGISSGMG